MTINQDEDTPMMPQKPVEPSSPPLTSHTPSSPNAVVRKVLFFFISMTIGIMIAIIYTNQSLKKQIAQVNHQIQAIAQAEITLKQQSETEFKSMLAMVNQRFINTSQTLQTVLKESRYQSDDWLLLKAKYYLELATINQDWSQDKDSSLALLNHADTLLASVQTEPMTEIRKAIASEKTALMQVPAVDTTGILSTLAALQDTINQLKPKTPLALISAAPKTKSVDQHTLSWRDHLKESLKQLDRLIVVHHQDEMTAPLLTPAYAMVLSEVVRLNLQEAAWSVLEKNQTIYQLSLTQAIENIKRVFNLNEENSKQMLAACQRLQQIQLAPEKPQLGQALQLLNQLIQAKQAPINQNDSDTPAAKSGAPDLESQTNQNDLNFSEPPLKARDETGAPS